MTFSRNVFTTKDTKVTKDFFPFVTIVSFVVDCFRCECDPRS